MSHTPWKWSANWVVDCIKKLKTCLRPIANKYHEGKMKRTLKRELKVPELTEGETNGIDDYWLKIGSHLVDVHHD